MLVICSFSWQSPAYADFQKTKIAVLDFELIGDKIETTGMGAILSEWFTTGLVKSGRFEVVERAMLQKIITEQKLSASGAVDEASAAALGKILGVKVIITGSVLKMHDNLEINSRVISVESGSIIAAENIRNSASNDLHLLVDELIAKILRNFPLTGYVVKKDTKTVIIDLGLDAGLVSGTEFIAYKEGEVIKHPKTGEVLDVEQIVTGRLKIVKVSKNVAVGDIQSEEPNGIQYGHLVKSVQNEMTKKVEKSSSKTPQEDKSTTEPAKPTIKEAPSVKETPSKETQPAIGTGKTEEPLKPRTEPKQTPGKMEKKKTMAQPPATAASPPAVNQAPIASPPATEQPVASVPEDKVAIFPFETSGDAKPYANVLAERLFSRISEVSGLTLVKSAYKLKGIQTLPDINIKEFLSGSLVNVPLLAKKGAELNIHFAVLARLDIACKDSSMGSNNCDIRKMEVIIVNLASGKVYSHNANSGVRSVPEDAMDEACKVVFKKFAADFQ